MTKQMPVSDRIYRGLLAFYPAEFRKRYGQEMRQVFRDCYQAEWARSGTQGVVRLWLCTLVDLACTASGEHLMNMQRTKALSWVVFVCGVALRVMSTDVERFSHVGDMLIAIGISWRLLIYVRNLRPAKDLAGASRGSISVSERSHHMFSNPIVPALCALFAVLLVIDLLYFIDLSYLMPLTSAIGYLFVLIGISVYFVWRRSAKEQASDKQEMPLSILEGKKHHQVSSHDEHGRTPIERLLENEKTTCHR